MEPVRADRGAIHATTNTYGQMVFFREIARDLVRLREWGCAHERYRPARAQLRKGPGGFHSSVPFKAYGLGVKIRTSFKSTRGGPLPAA
eukprot:2796948-Prymnesium_polylepis.1